MPIENEYKFTSDSADPVRCTEALRSFLESSGAPFTESEREYTDRYFDSSDMAITSQGCFLRQRTYSDGTCRLTVKRPVSDGSITVREETERASDGSFEDLRAFAGENFPGVGISPHPTLVNVCRRRVFSYGDGSGIKLSFDMCQYAESNRRKDYFEIELEHVSDAAEDDFDHIGVARFVIGELGFSAVADSKYVRGLRWASGQLR